MPTDELVLVLVGGLFVVEALKDLLANDGFINLLRAEGLATMPRALKVRVSGGDHG